MLTEHDVLTLWRQLFQDHGTSSGTIEKAQRLLDKLRSESPLRLRLATELQEIGKLGRKK